MTKKLYYEDSHQDSCHATVLSCTWNEKKQCYEVVLNQTDSSRRAAASTLIPEAWAA